MSDDPQRGLKAGAWRWLGEVMHSSSRMITSLVIVATFAATIGAWLYDNLVAEGLAVEVRQLAGSPQILEAVEAVDTKVEVQSQRIERLGLQVEAITPPPVVTEYDPIRSRALDPCFPGDVCVVQLRIRRTAFGQSCGVPEVLNRTFVDSSGLLASARPGPDNRAARASVEWTARTLSFIVPEFISPGIGEFYMTLSYPNCEATTVDGRRVTFPRTEEDTIRVPVFIEEPAQ